jgi:hypothetical protein
MYKRDDKKADSIPKGVTKEQRKQRGENAWHVFNSWKLLPGSEGQTVAQDVLERWIATAREGCAKIGKTIGGDIQIGAMLSRALPDSSGAWPPTAVRNIIEALRSKTVEEHVIVGLYNGQGWVARSPGGGRERQLSVQYRTWATIAAESWPRTAAMLRQIADGFSGDAKSWDIESQLDDLRS